MIAYQLKITMKYTKPPVWRRISIPAAATFAQLHAAIQCLFGFDDTHLHEFAIPKLGVTISNEMLDHGSYDFMENDLSLGRMLNENSRVKYCYDFGMSWEMDILVEKILNQEQPYPLLIKYKGDKQFEDDAYGWGPSFSPDFVRVRLSKMVCENKCLIN